MKLDSDRPLLLPIPTPSTGAEIPDSGRVLLDITKIMSLMGKGGGGVRIMECPMHNLLSSVHN